MAVEEHSVEKQSTPTAARCGRQSTSFRRTAVRILLSLASLKLTVVLFLFGIFLTWAGTMAQRELDMWEVISGYFRAWFTWIELRVFFPHHWFPNMPEIPSRVEITEGGLAIPLAIPFPGGLTIGALMAINLIAAHAMRFKLQARGGRLAIGLAAITLGSLLTLAVILGGHAGEGLQGGLPFGLPWTSLWLVTKIGLILIWLAAIAGLGNALLAAGQIVGRWLLGATIVVLGGLLAWIWFPGIDTYLGDSSMRVLWQLIQGGLAGVVLLVGCILTFKKRGGIVLIHAGVGLLMAGVLLGSFATEEQISIEEGRTANFSRDIRSIELAVTDRTYDDSQDRVVVVPQSLLLRSLRTGRVAEYEPSLIERALALVGKKGAEPTNQYDSLPFDLEVVEYYKNSELRARMPQENSVATHGEGLIKIAGPKRANVGADSGGEVNVAAMYVKFTKKGTSESLGTYLLSQVSSSMDRAERVVVDGHPYYVQLRFKRSYKPYSMFLADVRKDDYIGTDTPQNYSSDVRLVHNDNNVDRDIHIWMNNPLRYEGETFYQSGYHELNGIESTVLQVVRNTGWMIPYVACMLVATGLLAHFSTVLLRFLQRRAREELAGTPVTKEDESDIASSAKSHNDGTVARTKRSVTRRRASPAGPDQQLALARPARQHSAVEWILALAVVMFFAAWLGSKALPATLDFFAPPHVRSTIEKGPKSLRRSIVQPVDDMNIYQCGSLPTVYEGRVKPLDTLARNSLRVIANRETFYDLRKQKQPAIVWLLDVISGSKAAERHKVFRIDDPDVKSALGLTWRRGHRYSWNEINRREGELRRQVGLARQLDSHELSNFQRKMLELNGKVQLYFALRNSHIVPASHDDPARLAEELFQLANASRQLAGAHVPLAVPVSSDQQQWQPLTNVATINLVKKLAKQHDQTTIEALSREVVHALFTEDQIQKAVDARLLSMVENITASQHPEMNRQQVQDYAKTMLEKMPAKVRANVAAGTRREVLGELAALQSQLAQSLHDITADSALTDPPNAAAASLEALLVAYREGDAERFNREVGQYQQALAEQPPADFNSARTRFEALVNRLSPFTFCIVCYVCAFLLSALAWAVWHRPLNRAALALIVLAFAVHTFALIARMIITERPLVLVTNLYSSAIVIGWAVVLAGIVLELVFRLGIGNVMATVIGFGTLLIAHYLSGDGDTLSVMQAVLDTNIWLATHVTCVTFGYAATFAAGLLGIGYIAVGVATPALSKDLSRLLARITYGVICFAIFFSFVGTVLGGLWADDSWGRFWGWDPKENGALMIVLWNAVVLHARWGAMIKDRGLAVLVVVGNIVTAWSWFGVNELGVGLHSYGFTQGVLLALGCWIVSQLMIVGVGCLPLGLWWSYRRRQQPPPATS